MIHLAPSILSADFLQLGKQIDQVKKGGADYLHFDVMDGVFVPSISFGMPVLENVKKSTDLFLDVHLMITEPEKYVEKFAELGADMVTVHLETLKDPDAILARMHNTTAKVGLAINPATPVEELLPYLHKIDMAVIMTVQPGFGGQSYLSKCTEKIEKVAAHAKTHKLDELLIEVDGGVKLDNVETPLKAGANVIVAGSAIFLGDAKANTKAFVKELQTFEK
ncbi:MAG: ribulose-phosphate 3-epimerase [Lachnospiraceae bacterium]|nr:ribulose-phosphate 3-epimerase [Lachnospiraceae bacterium]